MLIGTLLLYHNFDVNVKVMKIAILYICSQTLYTGRKSTPHSYPLHVLVPAGHEQEAVELVQRFRTEVIQAREQAWQRQTNPPEQLHNFASILLEFACTCISSNKSFLGLLFDDCFTLTE